MKISYEWLKDYLELNKSPVELADDLSLFGHEVETIEKIGDDYIFDLEITPNRGDCLSVLGLARELSALYNLKIKDQNAKLQFKTQILAKKLDVRTPDSKICPRFTARIIDEIKIESSPKWIQARLKKYGFRPLNNIVDITNYVMIDSGQPLHAFDYDKIQAGLMHIRCSQKGEKVTTLDNKNHLLKDKTIIIEDNQKIYDLAGIMGGLNSEVDKNTKTIVLQGAIFDPVLIRRASKYLNQTSDASYRYERGVDFEGTIRGIDKATNLILQSCPQAKAGMLIDIKENRQDAKIPIKIDQVNRLIGTNLSFNETEDYLKRLAFKIDKGLVRVPSFREFDVKIWQDLAEEIARMYGYNKINKIPIKKVAKRNPQAEDFLKREYIKDYLTDFGFVEVYSYSFVERDKIQAIGDKINHCVEIANPLSKETQFLRPSILPSLISIVAKNPWAPEINIFEIGKVFTHDKEFWQLGITTTDRDNMNLRMRLDFLSVRNEIKKIPQEILDRYKIRRKVWYAVINLDEISIKPRQYRLDISQKKYRPISKFAPTIRDLAFVVEKDLDSDSVKEYITTLDEQILFCEVFDEFLFDNGTKNLALHIWLQSIHGPLSDQETNQIIKKIVNCVEKKFSCQLRR